MNFIEYVKKLHKFISQVDFGKIDLTNFKSILFFRGSALLGFSLSGLKDILQERDKRFNCKQAWTAC